MTAAAAAAAAGTEVPNRQVILKRRVTGFPAEDDMEVVAGVARLAVPPASAAVVLKNLYLSCDPYMRGRMSRHERPSYVPDFVPGEVTANHSNAVSSNQITDSVLFFFLHR
jgi:NADPH-dependent curcumin reductase CurA